MSLFKNIRFYVLSFNVLLAIGVYLYYHLTIPDSTNQIIKLTEAYALLALLYLYLALLASPFTRFFTFFPWRGQYLRARRAIGVSAFFFGLTHASLAFFGQLGGFEGLFFLDSKYLIAISLSTLALIILACMASTSFDYMVTKLTFPRWKMLHRLVYIAAIAILIHALLLGSHFANLSELIPTILFIMISFLLILESFRFDNYLKLKWPVLPSFGVSFGIVLLLIAFDSIYLFFPSSAGTSLNIHAQHILLAQQAQQQANQSILTNNGNLPPTLVGDRTKRFNVSFLHPDIVEASHDANLRFQIFDASNGNQVNLFQDVYSKTMHLVIVDSDLNIYSHVHPTQDLNGFFITTQFPHDGIYHLYENFQPLGAIEQQSAQTINIGDASPSANLRANQAVDTQFTKTFGNYEVGLDFPKPLLASQLSTGGQKLTFTIKDAATKNPITTLKPYLSAFGHLVMINEQTYDYLHVHPTNLIPPAADSNGGPTVEFLPLGLYAPIKPGIYRVFAQFNPDNQLFTADFTVNIE